MAVVRGIAMVPGLTKDEFVERSMALRDAIQEFIGKYTIENHGGILSSAVVATALTWALATCLVEATDDPVATAAGHARALAGFVRLELDRLAAENGMLPDEEEKGN